MHLAADMLTHDVLSHARPPNTTVGVGLCELNITPKAVMDDWPEPGPFLGRVSETTGASKLNDGYEVPSCSASITVASFHAFVLWCLAESHKIVELLDHTEVMHAVPVNWTVGDQFAFPKLRPLMVRSRPPEKATFGTTSVLTGGSKLKAPKAVPIRVASVACEYLGHPWNLLETHAEEVPDVHDEVWHTASATAAVMLKSTPPKLSPNNERLAPPVNGTFS
jgi:hypothetical protein